MAQFRSDALDLNENIQVGIGRGIAPGSRTVDAQVYQGRFSQQAPSEFTRNAMVSSGQHGFHGYK
jgi:hypothetical protein